MTKHELITGIYHHFGASTSKMFLREVEANPEKSPLAIYNEYLSRFAAKEVVIPDSHCPVLTNE